MTIFLLIKHFPLTRGKLGEKTTKVSDELMETKVLHESVEKCTSMTEPLIKFNPESMICAYAKGTDACQVRIHFQASNLLWKNYFRVTQAGLCSSNRSKTGTPSSQLCLSATDALDRSRAFTESSELL